jgi:hypothetical protein
MTVAELYQGSECGLLSVAFDPNFGENGYVYFFMTVSSSEQRIVRYRAAGNVGVEPTIIVAGLPTLGANHDGGALAFGPDGKLYFAIGDLGPGTGVDDDLQSLAAKVGRVNRDGTVPLDNPFHDGGGPNDDRIWARGFRNPFTMTFRPTTGELWLNVVGTYFEQVFVVAGGAHGGWNDHEQWQPDGYLAPVVTYPTNDIKTRSHRYDVHDHPVGPGCDVVERLDDHHPARWLHHRRRLLRLDRGERAVPRKLPFRRLQLGTGHARAADGRRHSLGRALGQRAPGRRGR